MMQSKTEKYGMTLLWGMPLAEADMSGAPGFEGIGGKVSFYPGKKGTIVVADISGLPDNGIFAFHIHEGTSCIGNEEDPFADAKGHYNPHDAMHPYHAGDLPPLFGNHGSAWMAVETDRFKIGDILGKTIIIHRNKDDFTTQPAGNAGEKIACGMIEEAVS